MPNLTPQEIQVHAYAIAKQYGGNLTVRQLYYQFVALGLLDSGQKVYRRVVDAVSKARLSGAFPFGWIVDRTRTCEASNAFENKDDVDDALDEAAMWTKQMPYVCLKRDRWYRQPKYVTVGVEKEALAGVFEKPCKDLGVGLFVFRGYSSLSALYQLVQNLSAAAGEGVDEAVMLYYGDHDPDGFEIPRAAARSVRQIARVTGEHIPPVRWERVALNMDQIEEFNPPAFGAKMTSSRYQGYVDEQGTDDAWELDALRPDVLQRLIREHVEAEFDQDIYHENIDLIGQRRAAMREQMCQQEWMDRALEIE